MSGITPGGGGTSWRCSECGGETRVTNSRSTNLGGIKRRRECIACGLRISTVEVIAARGRGIGSPFVPSVEREWAQH